MTVLNTIVAESLDEICTILEPVKDKPEEFHTTLNKLLQDIIKKHKRILFSGDGYGEAWIKEAERRKLANTPGTIEALAALETPKARALFEKYKVVSPVELHARHEIQSEIFHKEINIEAETALLMVETLYIPAVTEQLTQLTSAIAQMKASGIKAGMKATTDRANRIGELLDLLPAQVEALRLAVDKESTKDILTGMNDFEKDHRHPGRADGCRFVARSDLCGIALPVKTGRFPNHKIYLLSIIITKNNTAAPRKAAK